MNGSFGWTPLKTIAFRRVQWITVILPSMKVIHLFQSSTLFQCSSFSTKKTLNYCSSVTCVVNSTNVWGNLQAAEQVQLLYLISASTSIIVKSFVFESFCFSHSAFAGTSPTLLTGCLCSQDSLLLCSPSRFCNESRKPFGESIKINSIKKVRQEPP